MEPTPKAKANARLIAKAPQMLSLLELVVKYAPPTGQRLYDSDALRFLGEKARALLREIAR